MLPPLFSDFDVPVSLEDEIITSSPFISTLPASIFAPSYFTVSPASALWVPPTSNLEFTFVVPSPFPFPLFWDTVTPPKIVLGSVEIFKSALIPLDEDLLE